MPPLYGVNLAIENSTDGGKGEGKNHKLPQKCDFFKIMRPACESVIH